MSNKKELQLVNFEQAKKLKEMGFDYPCRAEYILRTNWKTLKEYSEIHDQRTNSKNHNAGERGISAPEIALVFQWLRNEKGVEIEIRPDFDMNEDKTFYMSYTAYYWQNCTEKRLDIGGIHCNKELAEQLALNKALDFLPL